MQDLRAAYLKAKLEFKFFALESNISFGNNYRTPGSFITNKC